MEMASAVVAVGLGLLMGWSLGGRTLPRRPVALALLVGAATGALVLVSSYGSDPSLVGWSLLLGCGAALASARLRVRG